MQPFRIASVRRPGVDEQVDPGPGGTRTFLSRGDGGVCVCVCVLTGAVGGGDGGARRRGGRGRGKGWGWLKPRRVVV